MISRVYKYNLRWQIRRISNKKIDLMSKLQSMLFFIEAYSSNENKERVLNYLKGLKLAYKTEAEKNLIQEIYDKIDKMSCISVDDDIKMEDVDTETLITLYKDLYKRNAKWLKKNYKNKDLNSFLEVLYNELLARNEFMDKNFDTPVFGDPDFEFLF